MTQTQIFIGKTTLHVGLQTAINKTPIRQSIQLSELGLVGNESADKLYHGGLERALHHYPAEHYQYWQKKYGVAKQAWHVSGMGENISTFGLDETNVCIGDQFQWGEAIIEVSQPRSPCFKLNKHWGISRFSVQMQNSSRCGWLLRVIKTGRVPLNAPLLRIQREENAMTIKAVCDIFFGNPLDTEGLQTLLKQKKLSLSWLTKIEQRLDTGEVENWNYRLLDHA